MSLSCEFGNHTHTHTQIYIGDEITEYDRDSLSDESEIGEYDPGHELTYTIKLVNPSCKKEFSSVELGNGGVHKSLASLQGFLSKKLSTNPKFKLPDLQNVEMGYVEPGHGMKGRKIWIHTDDDVNMMYEKHDKKKSVLLWCYTSTAKTKEDAKSRSDKGGTKHGQHLESRSAVDEIYKKLQEKHTDYTPRRLRAWANMVQLKSWTSLDEPPNKPFFNKGRKRSHINEDGVSGESPARKKLFVVSPGSRAW